MPPVSMVCAERLDDAGLSRQADHFSDEFITRHLLDAIPSVLLILNAQRQIVYANRGLLELLGAEEVRPIRGLRPGEALHCVNAADGPDGCGTADHCRACGMFAAILAALGNGHDTRECRFTRQRAGVTEAIDLRVRATPLDYAGERFTIFALADISHEKRRQALERIFFHDILNLAGGIRGFAEVLATAATDHHESLAARIHQTSERIIDEILSQRTLAAAESQDLRPRPGPVAALELLCQVSDSYRHHECARGRDLRIAAGAEKVTLVSDATLLGRVLGNMLKNALEATAEGETVTAGCRFLAGEVEFWVHNPAIISQEAQLQIFQRSFSTRGPGRGLGTYGMRLLSEDYLGGRVAFRSAEGAGTTFTATFPQFWPGSAM